MICNAYQGPNWTNETSSDFALPVPAIVTAKTTFVASAADALVMFVRQMGALKDANQGGLVLCHLHLSHRRCFVKPSESQCISMPTTHNVLLQSGRILAGGMTVALGFNCSMMLMYVTVACVHVCDCSKLLMCVTVGVYVQAPAAA